MAAFVSFYINNSFLTTLNDAFMGKTDGFLSWTPNWDQNLKFLPLREMMGISVFYIWEPVSPRRPGFSIHNYFTSRRLLRVSLCAIIAGSRRKGSKIFCTEATITWTWKDSLAESLAFITRGEFKHLSRYRGARITTIQWKVIHLLDVGVIFSQF